MPRTGRGGDRQGTIGQAYSNRTDLNASMPVATQTGQDYGQAAAQQAAQRAIPVASQPLDGIKSNPITQGVNQQAPTPQPQTITGQMPQQQVYPGELKFDHPTDAPEEPITAGIPIGEGAGPEALHTFAPQLTKTLEQMASAPGASAMVMDLARAARNIGL